MQIKNKKRSNSEGSSSDGSDSDPSDDEFVVSYFEHNYLYIYIFL